MRWLSFAQPFTRRQCALLLLALTALWWVYGISNYTKFRQGQWHVVRARVIQLPDAPSSGQVLLYEFNGEPYVATSQLPDMRSTLGETKNILVHEGSPDIPILNFNELTKQRLLHGLFLIFSSGVALVLTLRLVRTLDAERSNSQTVGYATTYLTEEFATTNGWSAGFREMIERHDPHLEPKSTRASTGSGTTVL